MNAITYQENPSVSQIIGCVMSLLADPLDWLNDATAKNLLDEPVSAISTEACKFSLVGAIHRVIYSQELTSYWNVTLTRETLMAIIEVLKRRYGHVLSHDGSVYLDKVSEHSSTGELKSAVDTMNDITSFDYQHMMEILMTSMWLALEREDETEEHQQVLRHVPIESLIEIQRVVNKFLFINNGDIRSRPTKAELLNASKLLHQMIHQL